MYGDDEIVHVTTMRIVGGLLIILSIAEFGIGSAAFVALKNQNFGSWWAAILTFVAGICGFALVIAIIGAAMDGIANDVLVDLKACQSLSNGKYYGDEGDSNYIGTCAYNLYARTDDYGDDATVSIAPMTTAAMAVKEVSLLYFNYYDQHPYQNYYYHQHHNIYSYHNSYYEANAYNNINNYATDYNPYDLDFDCVCTDEFYCYGYTFGTLTKCGEIMTTYTSLMGGSAAILSILCVVCFIYSIISCCSCCKRSSTVLPVDGGVSGQMTAHVQWRLDPNSQMLPMNQPTIYTPQYVTPAAQASIPIAYAQPIQYAPIGQQPQYPVVYEAQYAAAPVTGGVSSRSSGVPTGGSSRANVYAYRPQ